MTTRRRTMPAPPEEVWRVLSDGWTYPLWVVGASHMRSVDAGWPAARTRLHHAVGPWPLLIKDDTVSLEADPPRRLELQARGWPLGEARIVLELEARGGGTLVSISEDAALGPGRLLPRPLRSALIWLRNGETLARLQDVVLGTSGRSMGAPAPG